MKTILIEPSGEELQDTVDYYNAQMDGLGHQFLDCFQDTIRYIKAAPEAWRLVGANTRRINVKRFPYMVLYVLESDTILVTCVAHQHRSPEYYVARMV
jgi:toxin ParE1/3/4